MLYTVKHRHAQVICSDVDKNTAKAVCQLLYFLVAQKMLQQDVDLKSIEVESVEEVHDSKPLLQFIHN